jgi:hypothetical protein
MKTTTISDKTKSQGRKLLASIAGCAVALMSTVSLNAAEEMKMPEPVKEHQWLERFAGEWESEGQCFMDPDKPQKMTGTEQARKLGDFWVITEGKGTMGETQMSYVLTLGYDTAKKQYVGTWVDSMTGQLWDYEGSVSEDGNTLTLTTEGPCPMHGGKVMSFKEVIEFTDPDTKVFTSFFKDDDGEWKQADSVTAKRKKS